MYFEKEDTQTFVSSTETDSHLLSREKMILKSKAEK